MAEVAGPTTPGARGPGLASGRLGVGMFGTGRDEELRGDRLSRSCNSWILASNARMMAWASGVWRAISSSVISSDMPFMLRKSRRLARSIRLRPHPGPWPITRPIGPVQTETLPAHN